MAERSGLSLLWQLFVTGQHVKQLLGAAMADAPLTPDEYAVYSVLFDLGPKSPTELARAVGMPPTTMSHYVRAILERGHATRQRSASDGRSYVLALTDAGLGVHRQTGHRFNEANRRFRASLDADESFLEASLREIGRAAESATRALADDRAREAG
jgi:DNA-binding MarR family transcriptional regulator